MAEPVTILTAELARLALESKEDVLLEEGYTGEVFHSAMRIENLCGENIVKGIEGIATGRTFVAAKLTEAQAREAFLKQWNARPGAPFAGDRNKIMAEAWWLAALRHIGALVEKGG